MSLRIILFLLSYCVLFCNAQSVSNHASLWKKKTLQTTLFKKFDHYIDEELMEVRNNFMQYKLADNTKLILHLENELQNKTSFERGLQIYYKIFLYHQLKHDAEAQNEVNNLKDLIPKIDNADNRIYLKCQLYFIQVYTAEDEDRFDLVYQYSKKMFDTLANIKNKENYYYYSSRGRAANNIGNALLINKKFTEADKYLELARIFFSHTGDGYFNAVYYSTKGYLEIEQGKPETALSYYELSLKEAYKNHCVQVAYNIYPMMATACEKLGEDKAATKYLLKYKMTNDTIQREKSEAENYLIYAISKSAEDNDKKTQSVYILTSLIVLAICSYFIYRYTKKKYYRKGSRINTQNGEKIIRDNPPANELSQLIRLSQTDEEGFYGEFQKVYPILYEKLTLVEPAFSDSEINFCMYLKLNYTTKEIAIYTNSTIKSIESKKYRIKKKADLDAHKDIYAYINSL